MWNNTFTITLHAECMIKDVLIQRFLLEICNKKDTKTGWKCSEDKEALYNNKHR